MTQFKITVVLVALLAIGVSIPVLAEPISVRLAQVDLRKVQSQRYGGTNSQKSLTSTDRQRVTTAIQKICFKRGIDVALDVSGVYAGTGILPHNAVDITPEVIEALGQTMVPMSIARRQPVLIEFLYFDKNRIRQVCADIDKDTVITRLAANNFAKSNNSLVINLEAALFGIENVELWGEDITDKFLSDLVPKRPLPLKLKECETGSERICGDWSWDESAKCYKASWANTATADIRVEKYGNGEIVLLRTDTWKGCSGFTARYEGKWNYALNKFQGVVEWSAGGRKWRGTWEATRDP